MWVKNLAQDNIMKASFPDIDMVYRSIFHHVYDDLFLSDTHAADKVKFVAYGRANFGPSMNIRF